MDSLNPNWLSIELGSIDESTEKWNAALQASYEASFHPLTRPEERSVDQILRRSLVQANSD